MPTACSPFSFNFVPSLLTFFILAPYLSFKNIQSMLVSVRACLPFFLVFSLPTYLFLKSSEYLPLLLTFLKSRESDKMSYVSVPSVSTACLPFFSSPYLYFLNLASLSTIPLLTFFKSSNLAPLFTYLFEI